MWALLARAGSYGQAGGRHKPTRHCWLEGLVAEHAPTCPLSDLDSSWHGSNEHKRRQTTCKKTQYSQPTCSTTSSTHSPSSSSVKSRELYLHTSACRQPDVGPDVGPARRCDTAKERQQPWYPLHGRADRSAQAAAIHRRKTVRRRRHAEPKTARASLARPQGVPRQHVLRVGVCVQAPALGALHLQDKGVDVVPASKGTDWNGTT